MENRKLIQKADYSEIMSSVQYEQQQRFIKRLPTNPYFTDSLGTSTPYGNREEAICHAYIQANRHIRFYFILDIDKPRSAFLFEDLDLPEPTIICVNPESTHCHYFYELKSGVTFPKKNENYTQYKMKPIKYYECILNALKQKIGADNSYAGHMSKNPLHPYWLTRWSNAQYSLSDLAHYLKINWSNATHTPNDEIIEGRNSHIFNTVRHLAYDFTRPDSTLEEIYDYVFSCVNYENDKFEDKLHPGELRTLTVSISNYCYKKRDILSSPKIKNKLTQEEIKQRQQISAHNTHIKKSDETKNKIVESINKLKIENKKISIAAIAKEIGMNRSWISSNYSQYIKSII